MLRFLWLLICIPLLVVHSCEQAEMESQAFGETIDISFAQTITFENPDLTIKFGVVQDSRCPEEVACVTAGEGVITLEVSKGGQTVSEKFRIAGLCEEDCGETKTVLGHEITLLNLLPYPNGTSGDPTASEDYHADIVVNN